jgi:hypothetical protein
VTYTADPVNGFNAVVDRTAPAVQKVAYAQPIAKVHAAPVYAHAGPIAKVAPLGYAHGFAAPVAKY